MNPKDLSDLELGKMLSEQLELAFQTNQNIQVLKKEMEGRKAAQLEEPKK